MTRQQRWRARTSLAWLTRAFVLVFPIVVAVAAAWFAATRLPEPVTASGMAGWWAVVIGTSFGLSYVAERVARRLLPLAALLNLSLVFPDQAPSRFKVALRTWSTGRMRRQVLAARERGVDDDPTRAAEFALSLVASLTDHDRLTRGHAERTRAYTDLLAAEMGLDEVQRDRLRWAALLHDIGKVRVAAEILNKEGGLEDSEWAQLQRHPSHGYELIAPIRTFLGGWAETVLHHHERYDGTGYPHGLAGRDIALGARIVAVADAYDAMTAVRSYQRPLSRKAAMRELVAGAGRQFDPSVVRAFLNVSVGAVRRVAGPVVLLAQLPFIGGLRRVIDGAGVVTAAGLGIIGTIGFGVVPDGIPDAIMAAGRVVEVSDGPVAVQPGPDGSPGTAGGDPVTTVPSGSSTSTSVAPSTDTSEVPPPTVPPTTIPTSTSLPPPTTTPPQSTTTTSPPPSTTTTSPPPSTTTTSPPPSTTTTITSPPPSTSTTTTTTTAPPNQPPIAADDAYSTDEDVAVTLDVLANDRDPERRLDVSSLVAVSSPTLGTATPDGAGLRYSPAADAFGDDSFRYRVCDLDGRCAEAAVAVAVRPVNDAPNAADDQTVGYLISDTSIDVLANDRDVDGDRITIGSFDATSALGGRVACDSVCTYRPPANWFQADTFSYVAADGNGGLDSGTVTVRPPELPPPIVPFRLATVAQLGLWAVHGL